jgi:hypothetical protein
MRASPRSLRRPAQQDGDGEWLGQKTKRGFDDYRGEKPVPTR